MTMQTCMLCGLHDHTVRIGLVEWREPVEGQRFSAVPRCQDREACRKRCELAGIDWELVE